MATNDNNNFGKHNMGDENWAPSSRVLAQPGGNSTIQLGWDDEPAAAAPARDTSRPRIIGGKIVYSQEDKQKAADVYNAAVGGGRNQLESKVFDAPTPDARPETVAAPPMMAAPVMEKTIEPVVAKTALAEATNNEAGEAYHNANAGTNKFEGFMNSSECPRAMRGPSTRINAPPGGHSSICFG